MEFEVKQIHIGQYKIEKIENGCKVTVCEPCTE